MRFRRCAAAAAVALFAVLAAGAGTAGAASCPWMNPTLSPNARAEMLLGAMSLSDKIAMTYQQYPLDYHYGAAGYIPGNPSLCIPDLVFNDAGQGVGDAQTGTTAFPAPIAQSASWDPGLQYEFGAALGQEASEKGIDVQLAPGIETDRVPMDGRNWEYASEDPFLSGQTGAAEVKGIQSQHVIVTLKHYIANSQETDRMTDSADVDQRTLEEMYAPQYDVAIHQGGAMGVMCSYNRINSVYACENPQTLKGMLDGQFGFTGMVVSDWGATHSTVASALNGLDIEMNVTPGTYFGPALETAVQDGQVPMSALNDMVLRILRAMFTVGVFDHPPAAQPEAYAAPVSTPEHVALARTISEEGTVLLKNQDGILPLTGSGQKIALIGPAAGQTGAENEYNGEGSGHIPEFGVVPVVSPLQGSLSGPRQTATRCSTPTGPPPRTPSRPPRPRMSPWSWWATPRARGPTARVSRSPEGRALWSGASRRPSDQNALISAVAAANPNTVVVLDTGGPVLMPWLGQIKGLFEAWYPGQEDGNALAALLFGDVDPSAHLPETFPASETAQPISTAAQWPGSPSPATASGRTRPTARGCSSATAGTRLGSHAAVPVWLRALLHDVSLLGPDSDADIKRSRGPLQSRDTGSRYGADVAQAYVGMPASTGEPPLQLKGYQKVWLELGQSKTVSITLPETSFAHWDTTAGRWVVTPGDYTVSVGDSSASLPLQATLNRSSAQLPAGAY